MTVFKTILKILNKKKGMLILYTAILISITVLNQTSGSNAVDFEDSKPDVLIVNKDGDNAITKGFTDYISKHSEIKDIDINNEEKVDDALFYRDVNFIIYIPKNFGKDLMEGKMPTLEYKSAKDQYSSYTKMLVEKYIKMINVYKEYYTGEELISKVNKVVNDEVKVELKTSLDTSKLSSMTRYFNFLNYALLAGCVYCISMILASVKENNVRKRTIISSYNYKKFNRIVLLTNGILILVMWIFYMVLSGILFKELLISTNGLAYILNALMFSICSLTIGFFIGNITQNKNAIGGIVNVVALGSSFLCGCFVPVEYMPDYVIKIAHVLPTYYFVANNELIKGMERFNFTAIKPLLINGAVVFGFSILFTVATNIVSRKKQTIA